MSEARMTAEVRLRALLKERIAVIDGAMGTMIQARSGSS
jgi:methionine synthase I (cobalamin-dependent)